MNLAALQYLCDPATKQALELRNPVTDVTGRVTHGTLVSPSGATYPIVRGVPRFVSDHPTKGTVESFGDEWNYFNFTDFKAHWLNHTVKNTFGSTDVFRDKVVVDAGGGSGAQTLWMLESGARHVFMLDLSHSVDDVVRRNLEPSGFKNFDVIQCSIDAPPLRSGSIDGIVICHNVIQHTPSVERTARALFDVVGPGGEFVFNCYAKNDEGLPRWVRFHLVYQPLRGVLSKMPFRMILGYARLAGAVRLIPIVGALSEKLAVTVRGEVPSAVGESKLDYVRRMYKATVLNTFDYYGSHAYQHHKTQKEIEALVAELQPDATRVLNADKYFSNPHPIGCALRVLK